MENTRRDTFIQSIIERINADADWSEKYYIENTDNPVADFVQSFYYGEIDKDEVLKALETAVRDAEYDDDLDLSKLQAMKSKELFDWLEPFCALSLEGIHCIYNEILSAHLGEQEVQLDDDLIDDLETLSKEEMDHVKKTVNAHLSGDYIYVNLDYNRWVLSITDIDLVADSIDAMNGKLRLIK